MPSVTALSRNSRKNNLASLALPWLSGEFILFTSGRARKGRSGKRDSPRRARGDGPPQHLSVGFFIIRVNIITWRVERRVHICTR